MKGSTPKTRIEGKCRGNYGSEYIILLSGKRWTTIRTLDW